MEGMELRQLLALPAGIRALEVEAAAQGFRFLTRLIVDWENATNRFDRPGECFFGAFRDGQLVAVGGLSQDPHAGTGVGRLRRVYVAQGARRQAVGQALVQQLLNAAAEHFSVVRLSTDTSQGAAFYRRCGFQPIQDEFATHHTTTDRRSDHSERAQLDSKKSMTLDEHELAQVRRFNKTLAWLPRFRIRNRVTPRVIQALLRLGQIGGAGKLARHGVEAETRVIRVDGVAVSLRIIRPKGPVKGVVLDFHGGGWVIGNAQMNDAFNVAMVDACNVATVSVDYRLAVTTPVEGLMSDCLGAARWLLSDDCEEFASLPVIVVGESAGGHLAAATLLALKAWPELLRRVKGAVLYYGVYDLTGTPSVRAAGPETLVLDGPGMVDALRMLTPDSSDEQRRQPPLSPLYGDFDGLPPALLFVGELDPLRDDTLEIAERWKPFAQVNVHQLPACPHGFIHFPTAAAGKVLAHSREWISQRIHFQTR